MVKRRKSKFTIYFWSKARFCGQVKWVVKFKKKKRLVHNVEITVPCKTKARATNPRGVITGSCSNISFQIKKSKGYKLVTAIIYNI